MYNKKTKLRECALIFVFFGFSNQKMAFSRKEDPVEYLSQMAGCKEGLRLLGNEVIHRARPKQQAQKGSFV
ncbi:hypothetical protein TSAR_010260, partial [Trichomalopsis sarcophagae]